MSANIDEQLATLLPQMDTEIVEVARRAAKRWGNRPPKTVDAYLTGHFGTDRWDHLHSGLATVVSLLALKAEQNGEKV